MAPSAKHFSFLFFLAFLSSQPSHARDSQFFSKVTPNPTTNNAQETVQVSNKEQSLNKQEQEPSFIPDTQNGYGLYGHESGQLPPTTTTTTTTNHLPYKTQSQEQAYKTNDNNHNYNYNKDAYVTQSEPQGMSEPRFTDRGYTTATTTNNYNNNPYVSHPQGMNDTRAATTNNNNNYDNGANYNYHNQQQQGLTGTRFMNRGYTTTANPATAATTTNYYQKQGMSDTRFLENGKYYYHVPKKNNYPNGYVSSSGVAQYNNNKGYYGNYNENNSMERYQNQEEFQESEEEYVP